jgi:hypothetical protein
MKEDGGVSERTSYRYKDSSQSRVVVNGPERGTNNG